ncbi:MAG TPA: hydroxyethylthiazole kinase, partial [Actinobacteria bacterium]|nr:hydroxyethylthiazole kinase [Actinomycetes bacterium]HEX21676.1 hydroxyethylthiazole kinase [Actinomycetota bacterium]
MKEEIAADLAKIRATKPLLHHITNMVVMNETANATLCLGALPVMAHAREEVEEMVGFAGTLILNIGTLYPELVESMIAAGKKANELNVPVIFDPVGVGATKLRTDSAKKIISEVNISVVRGNAAEVSILGGFEGKIKGVESIGGYSNLINVAKEFANQ